MEDIIALSGKAMQFHVVEASRVGGGGETSYKRCRDTESSSWYLEKKREVRTPEAFQNWGTN